MQHVMHIQVVNILTGYDIDFCIPVGIQSTQRGETLALGLCQLREISDYFLHCVFSYV